MSAFGGRNRLDKIRNPNPEILNKSEIQNEKNFKRKIKIYYRDVARLLQSVVPNTMTCQATFILFGLIDT
jgi:hypothetical protein